MATQRPTTEDIPPQHQDKQPGREYQMEPKPQYEGREYQAAGKLEGKTAIITGGDSGIGRSVAVLFAKEGADVCIVYLNEHQDAQETKSRVKAEGRKCISIAVDLKVEALSQKIVATVLKEWGHIDILVNNAAEQHPKDKLEEITQEQLDATFKTNIYSYFYLTKAVLPHLKSGGTIINTTSVTAYRGSEHLVDYASTKGAIVSFTRSLSLQLAQRKLGIRVNGVAPGPIWTPLIPSTFNADTVDNFGGDVPLGRPGQPEEVAPAYVFLASDDSSYFNGQILHPNGGEIINT